MASEQATRKASTGMDGWIHRITADLADSADTRLAPAGSARSIDAATARLGAGPVAWAVSVGNGLAEAVIREVPELGGGTAPFEILRMGTEAVTLSALCLLADPDAERDIPEESLLGDREFARRRLGLDKVLRGIRVAHAALAQALMSACAKLAEPVERAEHFRRISELLLGFVDAFSSRMTDEYQAEHDRWLTSGDAAREDTVRALLEGRPVREDTVREVLNYRLRGRHLAVVAWCDGPPAEAADDPRQAAAELLRRRGCTSTLVLPLGRTGAWAWGEPGTEAPPAADVADLPCTGNIRMACGSVRSGPRGFRQSHEDAQRTARVMRLNPVGTGPVADHRDMELATLLAADLPALRRFVGGELGALAADTRHAEQLRRTLHLYLRNERSLTVAAAGLHVARNTITYRVKRAQQLIGHDVAHRLPEILTALEAARTLGPAVLRTEDGNAPDTT